MSPHPRRELATDGSFAPIPHERTRLVVAPETADEMVIEHSRTPDRGPQQYGETLGARRCTLTLALRRGRARVMRNGALLHDGSVFPGMLRLSEPGDTIQGQVFTAMEAVSISMPMHRLTDRLPPRSIEHIRPILEPNAQTEQLGRLLLHLGRIDRGSGALFCSGIVDALLALMLDPGRGAPAGKRSFAPAEMQRIADFAEDRLGGPLGLSEWSAAFGLPAPEFARRFRATTGSAPYTYFLRRRIDRAQELLSNTDAPLVEIALQVGFCSQSHFTEAFRRATGVAPGQWRRGSR